MSDPYGALDLVAEAAVLVDDQGRIRHGNDRARAVLGLPADASGASLAARVPLYGPGDEPWRPWAQRPRVGDRLPEQLIHAEVRGDRRPLAVAGRWSEHGLLLTFRSAGRRERIDAVRGDVVATVSHELRSPLSSVKGFTRTLLAKWDRFSDEQKRAMLETVDADADRVTRLLGELLDVSRIDAGRVQLHRRPLRVEAVVDAVVDKARHRDLARDRRLEVDVVGTPPQVHADPDKLEQVVTNLLENALHHAPEGPVSLTVDTEGGEVRLTVADRGPGIPAGQRQVVFEKFGRGRDSQRQGTGLGLYITRGLIEAHGGRVWIEASDGGGAAFHVALPARGD